jgi:DNA (cytosine-5)-methyltransferase 1
MLEIEGKPLAGKRFIDLFAGIGGFHLAMESLGAECVYANEWDRYAQDVYEDNFGIRPDGDITKVAEDTIPDHEILCAGFPCQAFSIAGKQHGFDDARGTLFFDVARIANEKKPEIVFMENVKNFAQHDNGNTIAVVRATMHLLGYTFDYKVLSGTSYGIPQNRERVYMVCVRGDIAGIDAEALKTDGNTGFFEFPKPVKLEKHLEDLMLEEGDQTAPLYVDRPDMILRPGASDVAYADKPIRVGQVGLGCQGERIYSPKGCAVTLSAYGGGAFAKTGGYLVGDRARKLHVRECARIQGFPDTFRPCSRTTQAYKQFGNSVIVDVLQYIALEFAKKL